MSVTGKARSIARRGVKVQRRIAITQALFWPALVLTGVVVGSAVLLTTRRAHRRPSPAAADMIEEAPLPGSPAVPA